MRTAGADGYNQYIYDLSIASGAPLNSVTTILTYNRDASSDPEVLSLLRNAEAIFFAGGEQGTYIEYWSNTEIQSIVQEKLSTNVTIGGTSAGCALLGHWVYTGSVASTTSRTALSNPYDRGITITHAFVNITYLENVITDTHFGRLNIPYYCC